MSCTAQAENEVAGEYQMRSGPGGTSSNARDKIGEFLLTLRAEYALPEATIGFVMEGMVRSPDQVK